MLAKLFPPVSKWVISQSTAGDSPVETMNIHAVDELVAISGTIINP
jgi:hypothetical protein